VTGTFSGENIVCLGLLPWHGPWKAYHQLISRQACVNRVLCVDPPLPLRTAINAIRARQPRGPILERVGPALYLYRPPRLLATSPWSEAFSRTTAQLRLAHVRWLARRHGFDAPILWVFNPLLAGAVGTFGEKLVVYHVVDNYEEYVPQSAVALRESIRRNEEAMLKRADVVFTVSASLHARCSRFNPHSFMVPNGVDYDRFQATIANSEIPADMREIPRPIIGYVGVIQPDLDFSLLEALAAERPQWSMVFVGPDDLGSHRRPFEALIARPNVHYLGGKAVGDVPRYINACDVCLLPDDASSSSVRDCDNIKIYEYLACGRPVVATDIPSVRRFEPVVRIGRTHAEFVDGVRESLAEDPHREVERKALAREHTWRRRVDMLNQVIQSRLSARVATSVARSTSSLCGGKLSS
jgi:glycosyltransferase involved in cell wall biosynthesis